MQQKDMQKIKDSLIKTYKVRPVDVEFLNVAPTNISKHMELSENHSFYFYVESAFVVPSLATYMCKLNLAKGDKKL